MGDHFSTDVQIHPESRIRQRLSDTALDLDGFFLGFLHLVIPWVVKQKTPQAGVTDRRRVAAFYRTERKVV